MQEEIAAVTQALSMFAANYSDQEIIQWGLVIGPVNSSPFSEDLILQTDLTEFQTFITSLTTNLPALGGSREMLYDALYLSLHNITGAALPTPPSLFTWGPYVTSSPDITNFKLNWREDSKKVIIIFTDESGQSYLDPEVLQQQLITVIQGTKDLKVYTFTNQTGKENKVNKESGWEPLATSSGGKWFELLPDAFSMYGSLLEILDENICE